MMAKRHTCDYWKARGDGNEIKWYGEVTHADKPALGNIVHGCRDCYEKGVRGGMTLEAGTVV